MADAMAILITSGHPIKQVWEYSISQIHGFVKLAYKVKQEGLQHLSTAMRMSYHAEGKDFSEYIDSLGQNPHG